MKSHKTSPILLWYLKHLSICLTRTRVVLHWSSIFLSGNCIGKHTHICRSFVYLLFFFFFSFVFLFLHLIKIINEWNKSNKRKSNENQPFVIFNWITVSDALATLHPSHSSNRDSNLSLGSKLKLWTPIYSIRIISWFILLNLQIFSKKASNLLL